jgi:hypothetical protein
MPPAYVRRYVKRHKNDAADAEAICEAVTRANMRFVATKTPQQPRAACDAMPGARPQARPSTKPFLPDAQRYVGCGSAALR